MAKNWMAYEAAEAIMGNNVEEIAEVGSRYPLFTRTVAMTNSDYVLDLLKALPKVTARVVETGLKDIDDVESETETEAVDEAPKKETKAPKKEAKTAGKTKQKKEVEEVEDDTEDAETEVDYESMTSKALYKLCCDRGISSQCKKRDKASLIAVLKANDGAANEDEADDWGNEEEEETDSYAGKSAKELFKMCSDRGIKTKPKQSADAYVKLLKKADEAETETEDEDDEDDDWEI